MPDPPAGDRDDIVAHVACCKMRMFSDKHQCSGADPLARALAHRRDRIIDIGAGFDLYEGDEVATFCNQVDFAAMGLVAPREDCIADELQIDRRKPF